MCVLKYETFEANGFDLMWNLNGPGKHKINVLATPRIEAVPRRPDDYNFLLWSVSGRGVKRIAG
jgi:hypothetical protein